MKLKPKQIDEIVRFCGTMSASSFIGFIVGISGNSPIGKTDTALLGIAFIASFFFTLFLRRKE